TVYLVLLMVVYFNKKKIMNLENKIYSVLIIVTFAGLILDYWSTYLAIVDVNHPHLNFISKLYLVYLLTWVFLFTIYTFVISFKNSEDQISVRKIFNRFVYPIVILLYFVCFALVFI